MPDNSAFEHKPRNQKYNDEYDGEAKAESPIPQAGRLHYFTIFPG